MDADAPSPMKGIVLKVLSVVVFVCMSTSIKAAGNDIATGQITFYRSAFAMVPILGFLACRGALRDAFRTSNVTGHVARGFVGILAMSCGFYGLVHLPLPEAIAIGYAMPLLAVAFAAIFLGEIVRLYRWSAVLIGLIGVFIIIWPRLTLFNQGGFGSAEAMGAVAVLFSAALGATAMVLVRKLVQKERTHTIVLYFSLSAAMFSLATLPFGWSELSWEAFFLLMIAGFCGGIGQILLTESYRHADMSTIAPFEYTSIVLGIFIIYREHQLGLERRGARKHVTPQG